MGPDKIFGEEIVWSDKTLVEADLRQPSGVYYLRLCAEGYVPMQVPVTIRRGVMRDIPVGFFREEDVPEGFAVIPRGSVIVEEHPDSYWMRTDRIETLEPFAVSRTMVTNAQYIEFLNALIHDGKIEEALKHLPSDAKGTPLWHSEVLNGIRAGNLIPENIRFADGDSVQREAPVIWIRASSAKEWMQWKSAGGKWNFRFPTRREMLYLMRGTDARGRPWGDSVAADLANVKSVRWGLAGETSQQEVTPAGHYPRDISPVSHPDRVVYDVFGNARKMTDDILGETNLRFSMGAGYNVGVGSMVQSDPYFENIHYSHGFFVVVPLKIRPL